VDDVIKKYLVSLGFSFDSAAYNRFQAALNGVDGQIKSSTNAWAAGFVTVGASIVSTLATITTATVQLLDKTAEADLDYQKFAMRMYMARDAAKQFKIVTDAMGESYTYIGWKPELNEKYRWLMGEAARMQALLPADAEEQFRRIREMKSEFTLMKVELNYGLQMIALSFAKYMNIPLKEGQSGLRQLNEYIQEHMAGWSDKIAVGLYTIWRYASSTGRAIKDLTLFLKGFWDSLDSGEKTAATVAGVFAAFFLGGPWTKIAAAIGVVVWLIDDFYAYIDGRKSTLSPVWATLIKTIDWIGDKLRIATEWAERLVSAMQDLGLIRERSGPIELMQASNEYDKVFGKDSFMRMFDVTPDKGKSVPSPGQSLFPRNQAGMPADALAGFNRMSQLESSNRYDAIGPDVIRKGKVDNALGKYQIMRSNWPAWVAEARKSGIQVGDDWKNPANQDAVAQFKWLQYYKQFGNSNYLAAWAWHAGPDVARGVQKDGPGGKYSTWNDKIMYTTDYAERIAGHKYYPQTQSGVAVASGQPGNININMYGMSNEQLLAQVRDVVRAEGKSKTIRENRYPPQPGVAP
jgi:hypothetical protein